MPKRTKRVTSIDVARASGVSQATVSYVFNQNAQQSISTETQARVRQAAAELGYRPFAPARMLRSGQSRLILAVIPFEQIDPGLARDLKTLEAGLVAQGFSLISYLGVHDPTGQTQLSTNLTPAVIASFVDEPDPELAAFLRQFNVPIVSMSNPNSRQAVGKSQVTYLVQQGQRKIIFAAPERRDVQKLAQARLDGVRQQCAALGLELPLVRVIPLSRAGAQVALTQLLAQQRPPFGICCYNDEVALAVMAALADANIPVPEAVAVIGCDDIPLAQFSCPALTTVHFDMGELLGTQLENILAASQGKPLKAVSPTPLTIIRRSSA